MTAGVVIDRVGGEGVSLDAGPGEGQRQGSQEECCSIDRRASVVRGEADARFDESDVASDVQ